MDKEITAEDILSGKPQTAINVSTDALIKEALQVMARNKIGSILVMDGEKVSGIWTERDFVNNAVAEGFNLETARISDYMTTKLHYGRHSEPCHLLMDKFLGLRIRHLLIEKDGKFIGMISSGDVVKAALHEKFNELKAQNEKTSWEYYEEWKWVPGG